MPLPTFNFTTGVATLPDVGTLSYNGCVFSPLFASNVSGNAVKDEARRTVMYMEYTITVDGYVTKPATVGEAPPLGSVSIDPTMTTLIKLLTAQGGHLIYEGRGCDLNVNREGGGGNRDVAWGPVPELLEFQPLGGGLSAKVQWKVTVRIPDKRGADAGPGLGGGVGMGGFGGGGGIDRRAVLVGGLAAVPMLQFNYETSVSYGEDGFSSLSVRGVLEIPLTRTPSQKTRTLTQTADDLRGQIDARIMTGIDLNLFRVTRRSINLSRDKRVLVWDYAAEERPYMDLPPDCPVARGTYSVRPARAGMGLASWLCTLRATYTVRHDRPRRTAWAAFLLLLRYRMSMSMNAPEVDIGANPRPPRGVLSAIVPFTIAALSPNIPGLMFLRTILRAQSVFTTTQARDKRKAFLCDFSIDEGLYLDSKTVTFSATWRLVCPFSHILLASGIWTKVAEKDGTKKNVWATSMKDVQGSQSWLPNKTNAKLDVIVDFGGG